MKTSNIEFQKNYLLPKKYRNVKEKKRRTTNTKYIESATKLKVHKIEWK